MKSKFVEGIRIEKTGVRFCSNFEIEVSWGITLKDERQQDVREWKQARFHTLA